MKINKIVLVFLLFAALFINAQQDSTLYVKPLSTYPPELLKTDELGEKYYYDEAQKQESMK